MYNYVNLANIVMVLHVVLILSVFVGIAISIRYKRFRPIESFILLSAILIWSLYGGCPLTYLENYLRVYSGYPIPILEAGFIPYYFDKWFNFHITAYQLTVATYTTALVFLLTSIEWVSPFINFEIIKIRKYIHRTNSVSHR
jgi:hypothetical protein